jgi:hypothetical protein
MHDVRAMTRAWRIILGLYLLVLVISFGLAGPLPAFAVWSIAAGVLYGLTWHRVRVHPGAPDSAFAGGVLAWVALVILCISAVATLPEWSLFLVWIFTIAFIIALTETMVRVLDRLPVAGGMPTALGIDG